jgi:hypothetical protein
MAPVLDPTSHRAKSVFQFSIALCCLLFLLPVISASDNLHAMRQEMEESSPSKRALKQIAKRAGAGFLPAAGTAHSSHRGIAL